jgi:hypothetical protein
VCSRGRIELTPAQRFYVIKNGINMTGITQMSNIHVALDKRLHAYLLANEPPEHEELRRLRERTAKLEMARMQIAPEQGHFLGFRARCWWLVCANWKITELSSAAGVIADRVTDTVSRRPVMLFALS